MILQCERCGSKTRVGVKNILKLSCNCGGYKTTLEDKIKTFLIDPIGKNKEVLANMANCDLQGQPINQFCNA